jgi:hypothetical protein
MPSLVIATFTKDTSVLTYPRGVSTYLTMLYLMRIYFRLLISILMPGADTLLMFYSCLPPQIGLIQIYL